MRVNTRVVIDIASGAIESRESYEYTGPVERAGGGPSPEQRAAAAAQARASDAATANSAEALQYEKQQRGKITPYATSLMTKGLDWLPSAMDVTGATSARALAPGRADILRATSRFPGLPSGYRDQLLADYDAGAARSWEDSILNLLFANENAKVQGANLLVGQQGIANPLGWQNSAVNANESIMQAPLQSPGIGGILGGLLGSGMNAAATYFGGRRR